MQVIIKPWRISPEHSHVHEEGNENIHSRTGDIIHDITPADAIHIGKLAGLLSGGFKDRYKLPGMDCREFCNAVDDIWMMSQNNGLMDDIAGKISDNIGEGSYSQIDHIEAAVITWQVEEARREAAIDTLGPFDEPRKVDPWDIVDNFLTERERRRKDADEAAREAANDARREEQVTQ